MYGSGRLVQTTWQGLGSLGSSVATKCFFFNLVVNGIGKHDVGTPCIYTTTGFGLRRRSKMAGVYDFLVYMQFFQICSNTHKAHLRHAPRGRAAPLWWWCVCVVACLSSLHIHQEVVYTSHFLICSRRKPGGGVYVHGVPMNVGKYGLLGN